jgi:hypothetical protein
MWITFLIVAAFVVAIVAMAYFGIAPQHDALLRADGGAAAHGHCGLCQAPLRRDATSDEVVFELEHRIDADLCELSSGGASPAATLHPPFPA